MKKLRLELDDLAVESFASGEAPAGKGTVRGHSDGLGGPCITIGDCWEYSLQVACPNIDP